MEETINNLISQFNSSGGVLAAFVPVIVQLLKKLPFVKKANESGYPVYELLVIALCFAGAYGLNLPDPIVKAIIASLAAMKGYEYVSANGAEAKKK